MNLNTEEKNVVKQALVRYVSDTKQFLRRIKSEGYESPDSVENLKVANALLEKLTKPPTMCMRCSVKEAISDEASMCIPCIQEDA